MLKVWNLKCFLAQNTCYQRINQKFGSSYSTVTKYKKSEVLQNHEYENSAKLTWSDFLFCRSSVILIFQFDPFTAALWNSPYWAYFKKIALQPLAKSMTLEAKKKLALRSNLPSERCINLTFNLLFQYQTEVWAVLQTRPDGILLICKPQKIVKLDSRLCVAHSA